MMQKVPLNIQKVNDPREAAFLALWLFLKEDAFVAESLEKWRQSIGPSHADFQLARQIAYGAVQRALTLDYIAQQLSNRKKLTLKIKEKALLRLALFQACFLDRMPLYAIANEMLKLAKKYCHPTFTAFLNATLRKLSGSIPSLPKGLTAEDLSVRYSFPQFFIQELIKENGVEKSEQILTLSNNPPPVMVRLRSKENPCAQYLEQITEKPFPYFVLKDPVALEKIASSPCYYIQNMTPGMLMGSLCEGIKEPKAILDLCASPGGKLITIHDCFPKADLYANDVSSYKMERLSKNCKKYGFQASFTISKGEDFSSDQLFDLIILDVPCSNSGVLNKRPEARWRLTEEVMRQLEETQFKLLEHARTLLKPEGQIWYLTCSILSRENQQMVTIACQKLNLIVIKEERFFPSIQGQDGGFGCSIKIRA